MPKIFISYRHEDSQSITDRIYEKLSRAFSKNLIFKDISSLYPGDMWAEKIDQMIKKSDYVLVIIGKQWLDHKRLQNPEDWVRKEIETALKYSTPVIPVFVDNAPMPESYEIPSELKKLLDFQGTRVRNEPDFQNDIAALIERLGGKPHTSRFNSITLGAIVVALIASFIAVAALSRPTAEPTPFPSFIPPTIPITEQAAVPTIEPTRFITPIPATNTAEPTKTQTDLPTLTTIPPPTSTLTLTSTPTITETSTPTLTPTITNTPQPISVTISRNLNVRSCPALYCPVIEDVQTGQNAEICGQNADQNWLELCAGGWIIANGVQAPAVLTQSPIILTLPTPPGTCETAEITYIGRTGQQVRIYWTPPHCLMTLVVHKKDVAVPIVDKRYGTQSSDQITIPGCGEFLVKIFYEPLKSNLPVDEQWITIPCP